MDKKVMQKIGMAMTFLMGFVMSFVLSLTGTLVSGHFAIPAWLCSFGISFVLSLIIGFIIPMGRLNAMITGKLKQNHKMFLANLIDSFVSNVLYTPLMTAAMVFIARNGIPQEYRPPFSAMYLPSLVATFIVGWIVLFIIQPLFLKKLMAKFGVEW